MKNMFVCTCVAIFTFMLAGSVSYGQTSNSSAEFEKDLQLLRKDLRSEKKQLMAMNLSLTDAEAIKFWPIYDQYAADLAKLYDERVALIKDYAANYEKLTDATAADLNRRSINQEESMVKLKQKYAPIIAKVLTGKKAALFFQLDRRLSLLLDLQIAPEIPLALQ